MFVLYYMCRLSSIFLRGDSRICSLARVITLWSCQLGRSWSVLGSAPVAILFIISMLTLQCRLLFNRVGSCFLGVGLVDRVCVYGSLASSDWAVFSDSCSLGHT